MTDKKREAELFNKLISIDGEDATNRSLCDILRDTDPELEEVEGHIEQYYGVTDDYYEWERTVESFPLLDTYSRMYFRPFKFIDTMVYSVLIYHTNHLKQPVYEEDVTKLWKRYEKITDVTSFISKYMNKVINGVWGIFRQDSEKYVFFECFKECKSFMFKSVGIYEYKPIEAKTYRFDDAEKLVEFINNNKDHLVIYHCKEMKTDKLQLRCSNI